MWRAGTGFFGDSERCERGFGVVRECCQFVASANPGPKNARRMRVRKEADLLDGNRNRRTRGQAGEGRLQFRQPLLGPLADKLRGDVQVAGRAPVDLSGRLEAKQEFFQVRDNIGWKVNAS